MGKQHQFYGKQNTSMMRPSAPKQVITSLLDHMQDGHEFESILAFTELNIDLIAEIRRAISEIQTIRKRPCICYLGNIVNTNIKVSISIDYNDDLPFSEMIALIPPQVKEIDILLVTPGGFAQQVAKFVDKLRPRFDKVEFLLPNMAMSAGTIFAMSGDEIVMGPSAYIGPIDPQVQNKDGAFVPAQAILTLVDDIQKRGDELIKKGQNPPWTDLQMLKFMDQKEVGNAISASRYSIELVQKYLYKYKFKYWTKHSSDGRIVTDDDKKAKALEIAEHLCSHKDWKSHSRGITRNAAWEECKIKIKHVEEIEGLDKAIRRFWALMYWTFENTAMAKVFISENYAIIRSDPNLTNGRH